MERGCVEVLSMATNIHKSDLLLLALILSALAALQLVLALSRTSLCILLCWQNVNIISLSEGISMIVSSIEFNVASE